MEKSRDFQLFMTQNDEQQFCEELRGYNPNIFFLDISPSSEADISKRAEFNLQMQQNSD